MQTPTTNRRSLLGFLAAVPAVAIGATATASTTPSDDDAFMSAMNHLHPEGARAANNALAAGMKPKDLFCIIVFPDGDNGPGMAPAILFNDPGGNGRLRTFRPRGEDTNGATA